MSDNYKIKMQLIEKYDAICMLGGNITYTNPLTMHHIIKKQDGGSTSVDNGSLCASLEHSALHIISADDFNKKRMFIQYLREIKAELDAMRNADKYMKSMNDYLHRRMLEMEFMESYTKNNTKIFKKMRGR